MSAENLIPAFRKDDAFLADIESVPVESGKLHLWWLGQSGFLLQWRGHRVVLDPYLSDSLTRKYAGTDKPHVRMSERVVHPGKLEGVEIVTSSHNHTDHLDAATLRPLMRANPAVRMLVPAANRAFAADRLEVDEERLEVLDAGEHLEIGPFRIEAVPAAHEALETDDAGRHRFLGYVIRAGGWAVYHSGDTMLYPGMEERLKPFEVDVALLPINGRAPGRRVAGNLWGREAARLGKDIGARWLIPCHYDMFEFNTATTEEFEKTCREIGRGYQVLRGGEGWVLGE